MNIINNNSTNKLSPNFAKEVVTFPNATRRITFEANCTYVCKHSLNTKLTTYYYKYINLSNLAGTGKEFELVCRYFIAYYENSSSQSSIVVDKRPFFLQLITVVTCHSIEISSI